MERKNLFFLMIFGLIVILLLVVGCEPTPCNPANNACVIQDGVTWAKNCNLATGLYILGDCTSDQKCELDGGVAKCVDK
ncbi:MAG: hypothetical protein ABII01_02245 [Candidatus Woesearchaeota archaeon]